MTGAIKLASNEVPYGPLPGVPEAIAEAAANTHRYPDMAVVALREKLAARLGVDVPRVATGCGSVALIVEGKRLTEADLPELPDWLTGGSQPNGAVTLCRGEVLLLLDLLGDLWPLTGAETRQGIEYWQRTLAEQVG